MCAAARARVGIVVWNTATHLRRCLDALPAALDGVDAEIVVVDNASSDGSAEVAAADASARLIRNPTNVGYGAAMNQALAGTDAPVLIALNPDTEPPPGSLATLVHRLLGDPGVGLVAPRLVDGEGAPQYSARPFPSLGAAAFTCVVPVRWHNGRVGRRLRLEYADAPDTPADIDWAVGAVHVLRAEALDGRQPYDERWFMYVEDVELCWWLAQRGWRRRFESDVTVPHVGNVAGAMAWGDGYVHRCLGATYDWYQRDRGRAEVRAWAAFNALGAAARAVFGQVANRSPEHVAVLRRDAGYHARVIVRGAPPLAGPPLPSGPVPATSDDRGVSAGQMGPPVQSGEVHWAYDNPRDEVTVLVPPSATRVLDVGCSTGLMAESLRDRGHQVTGIETDPYLASFARPRTDHLVEGDVEVMATGGHDPGGPFDCIVLADVLEHLRDPWSVTRWAAGLLAPGGCLVISVPNIRHAETFWALAVRRRWPYKDVGIFDRTHLRFFARHNLPGLLDGTDLVIAELHRSYLLTHDQSRINRLAHLLGDLGTLQFIFRAERPGG